MNKYFAISHQPLSFTNYIYTPRALRLVRRLDAVATGDANPSGIIMAEKNIIFVCERKDTVERDGVEVGYTVLKLVLFAVIGPAAGGPNGEEEITKKS